MHEHEHKPIRLDELTLTIAKMDPDFWAAFQEAWARCQTAPALTSGIIIEAARDAAQRHGLKQAQYEMLKAYLEAED